jgi:hypothetical protein
MAAKYKIGDAVKEVQATPINGTIVERIIVGDDDVYKIAWKNGAGDDVESFFSEDKIELVV